MKGGDDSQVEQSNFSVPERWIVLKRTGKGCNDRTFKTVTHLHPFYECPPLSYSGPNKRARSPVASLMSSSNTFTTDTTARYVLISVLRRCPPVAPEPKIVLMSVSLTKLNSLGRRVLRAEAGTADARAFGKIKNNTTGIWMLLTVNEWYKSECS